MCTYVNRMTKFTTLSNISVKSMIQNRRFSACKLFKRNIFQPNFIIFSFRIFFNMLIHSLRSRVRKHEASKCFSVKLHGFYKVVSFSYFKFFFKFIYYHVLEVALKRLSNILNITLSRCLKITTRLHKANICRREFLSRKFLISYDLS